MINLKQLNVYIPLTMILQVDISYVTVFIPTYGGITPYKAQKALEVSATFL